MPIYLTTPYPMLYICSVMTRKGTKGRFTRTHHAASLQVAGFGDASMRRLYKEYIHAITPHGKGLGVGASVRTLPGAVKERMFERSEFLAPAANGFVRIAPKTQPLIFFFVTFFLHQGKKESEWIRGRSTLRPYNKLLIYNL